MPLVFVCHAATAAVAAAVFVFREEAEAQEGWK
jgi:hypothetical protein